MYKYVRASKTNTDAHNILRSSKEKYFIFQLRILFHSTFTKRKVMGKRYSKPKWSKFRLSRRVKSHLIDAH